MSDNKTITIDCGMSGQYTLTHDQVKRMLYAVEYTAVCIDLNVARQKAIQCLTEQGRAPVTIPVGAIVEACR